MEVEMEVKEAKDFWEARIGDNLEVRAKEDMNIPMIKIEYLKD
jgi:hypothetical protein